MHDNHSRIYQIYLLALATAEIFETEHTALFQLAPPHQRSAINLLAEGIYDIRDELESLIYDELDSFHEAHLQNVSLQTSADPV